MADENREKKLAAARKKVGFYPFNFIFVKDLKNNVSQYLYRKMVTDVYIEGLLLSVSKQPVMTASDGIRVGWSVLCAVTNTLYLQVTLGLYRRRFHVTSFRIPYFQIAHLC